MKVILALTIFLIVNYPTEAQPFTPSVSSTVSNNYKVGMTAISLDYSRPNVKARKIFGELIPYGIIWRTGANESTLIRFSTTFTVEDQVIDAGTYSIYTIPDESEWTFILNRDTTLWGARGYDQEKDA